MIREQKCWKDPLDSNQMNKTLGLKQQPSFTWMNMENDGKCHRWKSSIKDF